jgi:peptidoglycan/LPS O-acetylase OafA/YrhL
VVCFHALTITPFLSSVSPEGFVGRTIGLGYAFVSFFFLHSGYILGVVYLRREGPVQLGTFLRSRFARLYPLFFLTLLVDGSCALAVEINKSGVQSALVKIAETFAADVLMLQAWTLRWRFINEPSWSLSVLAILYLSFPFLGAALWKLDGLRLWITAAILYLGGQGLVIVAAQHTHNTHSELLKRLPILHITTFALGILLARWQTLERQKENNTGPRKFAVAYLLLVPVLLCCAAVIYWSPMLPVSSLHDGALAPIYLCVIWMFSQSQWQVARLLSSPWLVVLGQASFGLYLLHMPVFHLFEWLRWTRGPALFLVYLAVSIGLSVLSFYYFETPLRLWILKPVRARVKENMEMASDAQ